MEPAGLIHAQILLIAAVSFIVLDILWPQIRRRSDRPMVIACDGPVVPVARRAERNPTIAQDRSARGLMRLLSEAVSTRFPGLEIASDVPLETVVPGAAVQGQRIDMAVVDRKGRVRLALDCSSLGGIASGMQTLKRASALRRAKIPQIALRPGLSDAEISARTIRALQPR